MYKRIAAALCVSIFLATSVAACDICGGGVSTFNPYLFPHLSKTYFGLTCFRQLYRTSSAGTPASRQEFNALLLTAQHGFGRNVLLTATLPFQLNRLVAGSDARSLRGLGDLTLVGSYKVWEHAKNLRRQTLTAGIGVKLPTGRFSPVAKTEEETQNFQLGSGSTDVLLNAAYRVALQKWVFAATTAYKYNTQNGEGFRFGDVWTNGLTAAYRTGTDRVSFLPYATLTAEHFMRDAAQHVLQSRTGGDVFLCGAGADVNTRKITVGLNFQLPVRQNLSQGAIEAMPRLSARLSFLL